MKRGLLALVLLAWAVEAEAQNISGGVRFTLEPAIRAEVSIAEPAPAFLQLFGLELGGVLSLRAHADRNSAGAGALAGIQAGALLESGWYLQAQVLYRAVWQTDEPPSTGPELVLAFARQRGAGAR